MQFVIAAVALAALSQVASAIPMARSSSAIKPISGEMTTMAAGFPIHDLASFEMLTNFTSGGHGVHADATAAAFPATLLLCPSLNCASCFAFNMASLPINQCLLDTSSTFSSFAISQPSGAGLAPFRLFVGPANGCASGAQTTVVNECFNINGPQFQDFALLE
ncbi:hypothetical protein C8Q80DRAFT_399255 [Daedaleopsis nitida]|nr:hypothetical protein C8Q80DRAFT_399255 [Daedaleopsis nitida]